MIKQAEKSYAPLEVERQVQEFWTRAKVYQKTVAAREKGEDFYFGDGPPFTTGSIHLGQVLNKTIKDLVVRYHRMRGYHVRDQPGYDMHGLPIEVQVEKTLGITNKKEIEELGIEKFVNTCRTFAEDLLKKMTAQFQSLGIWLDWDRPYMTIRNEFIEAAWWTLKHAHERDWIYEALRSIQWCSRCETALADAEVEYSDETDPSIYVKFRMGGKPNESLLIWTTTPWTLPANLAIAAHPDFRYAKVKIPHGKKPEYVWLMESAVPDVMARGGVTKYSVVEARERSDLVGLAYLHPLRTILHAYGHCWRCKTPILFRATVQWFLKVTDFKPKMVEEVGRVRWFPDWAGSARQLDWTSNLRDWCISRQRYWGIPLPIWRCAKCNHWTVVGSAESLRGASGYKEGMDLHRPGIDRIALPCEKCDGEMRRVPDTVDVWFDSGVSSWASLGYPARDDEFRRWWPQDWIVEGPDQTRGWFNSQLAAGVVAFDRAPYDQVLMHGWVNGPDGRQMHKSLGNVIEPETVVDKFGVDPLRFYVIAVNAPWDDITFQEEGVRNAQRTLNILWNVLRFATTYMVLDRFDPFAADLSSTEGHLRPEDRWLLSRLEGLEKTVDLEMRSYNLHRAARAVEAFILDDLSRWYVKLVRGRTWTETDNGDKLAAYRVLFEALSTLAILLAPGPPHVAEAMYQRLDGRKLSVHMLDWPDVRAQWLRPELERSMSIVQEEVEVVSKQRQKGGRKLRWPLKLIAVRSATPEAAEAFAALRSIFLDQVNAKELVILEPADEFPGTVVVAKPDAAAIGKAYKALAPKIVKLLGTRAPGELQKAFERGSYTLHADGQTFEIEPTMVRFEKALPPEVVRVETPHGEIYLDLRVTPELQAEAYAREIVRRIQQMRKDLDLDIDDFIATVIKTNKEFAATLEAQQAFIARETRSRSLTFTDKAVASEHVVEWKDVDGHGVTIGVTPLHLSESIREFTRIPGLTMAKAMALFDAGYKSLAALRSATKQELLAVDGLDAGDVDRITEFLAVPEKKDAVCPTCQASVAADARRCPRCGEPMALEATPEEAYRLFLIAHNTGKKGMIITRLFPQKVRERFGLKDLPIVWLSNVGKEDSVRPKDLEKLSLAAEQFLSREKGVVLLDAIEYLVTNNNFLTVLRLVQSIRDQVAVNNGVLLLSVNPSTLDAHQMTLLEREVDQVVNVSGGPTGSTSG